MKYQNSHHHLPEINEPVYFIGPTAKEILGRFVGGQLFFRAFDRSVQGYYSKFWRSLTEQELRLIPKEELEIAFSESDAPKKRGRKPKLK